MSDFYNAQLELLGESPQFRRRFVSNDQQEFNQDLVIPFDEVEDVYLPNDENVPPPEEGANGGKKAQEGVKGKMIDVFGSHQETLDESGFYSNASHSMINTDGKNFSDAPQLHQLHSSSWGSGSLLNMDAPEYQVQEHIPHIPCGQSSDFGAGEEYQYVSEEVVIEQAAPQQAAPQQAAPQQAAPQQAAPQHAAPTLMETQFMFKGALYDKVAYIGTPFENRPAPATFRQRPTSRFASFFEANPHAINTRELCAKVLAILYSLGITQTRFAKVLLARNQGTVSQLLKHPKPWHEIGENGRVVYKRMELWCDLSNNLKKRVMHMEHAEYSELIGLPVLKEKEYRPRFQKDPVPRLEDVRRHVSNLYPGLEIN